jgi:intraflagellar transport protein 52
MNKDEIDLETLDGIKLLIIGCPREMFSLKEFEALKKFISSGRSVFILMNEGGESKLGTNINYLLEQFGISVNADSVVRTSYFKYLHPKEAYISNGIVSKDFVWIAKGIAKPSEKKKGAGGYADKYQDKADKSETDGSGLNYVYSYGASLLTQKPAFPILSTGPVSYPSNRPIVSAYTDNQSGGRLLVCGSTRMFEDEFLDKEDNSKTLDGILRFLTKSLNEVMLTDNTGKDEGMITEYHRVPDTASLSDNLRSCL